MLYPTELRAHDSRTCEIWAVEKRVPPVLSILAAKCRVSSAFGGQYSIRLSYGRVNVESSVAGGARASSVRAGSAVGFGDDLCPGRAKARSG